MTKTLLRAGALSCALLASTALTTPATAQSTFQQQERQAPDANGVDVISGRVNVPLRSIRVGSDESGLTYASGWADGAYFDTFSVQITDFAGQFVVRIFGDAKRFTSNGDGTWTNLDADGATFVTTGSGYVYTARDGTIFTFLNSLGDTGWLATVVARISTIRRPNGETLTYYHRIHEGTRNCPTINTCSITPAAGRVQSVTSNLGFQLKATYATNNWVEGSGNPEFRRLTGVTAINNAVDYCNPSADTCGTFTQNWPQLTIGASTSGGTTTRTFIDRLNNTTTIVEGANGITSVTSPASATPDVTITYDGNGRVATFARGGGSWGYTYVDATVGVVN